MPVNITTEFPFWLVVFCLLAGLVYAAALYWRNPKEHFPKTANLLLGSTRFILVSLLAFFLLGPFLIQPKEQIEKPLILLLQDNSQSLIAAADSTYLRTTYPQQIEDLKKQLSSVYELRNFTFDDQLQSTDTLNFTGKTTNLGKALETLSQRYSHRNVGALILATDGTVNAGPNPEFQSFKYPVYPIGLGDTTIKKDGWIENVVFNSIAYQGDQFPVEITVRAQKSAPAISRIRIEHQGKTVVSKKQNITSTNFVQTQRFILPAEAKGIQKYSVILNPLQGETMLSNNRYDFYVEVLEGTKNILIVANHPHPDIAAIKQALETDQNLKVEVITGLQKVQKPGDYGLVICHQVPGINHAQQRLLAQCQKVHTPVWYILGQKSDLLSFNKQQSLLSIRSNQLEQNLSQAIPSPHFSLFQIDPELQAALPKWPPLQCIYGDYATAAQANTLLMQQIGPVNSDLPLLLFGHENKQKLAITSGTGLWRWRMNDYITNNNHHRFETLINQIARYLMVQEDRSYFRVYHENSFLENQLVQFKAELYNKSYELINQAEVHIRLTADDGTEYPFDFSRTDRAYQLNAGQLPPGNYQFEAQTEGADKTYTKSGSFTIQAVLLEQRNLRANHQLLQKLAQQSGGELVAKEALLQLPEMLQQRGDIKPMVSVQKHTRSLIDFKILFLLFLLLAAVEWFSRRYLGSY